MLPRGKQHTIGQPRELTRQDLERLTPEVRRTMPAVARFRDTHHHVARLVAMGLRLSEVAARSGYSQHRVYILNEDPAFQQLVAKYRLDVDTAYKEGTEDYFQLVSSNTLKAERMIADKLDKADEEDEAPSIRELISISRDGADRIGYGKRQTNINVNADFADLLDKAIKRSGKLINHVPAPRAAAPSTLPNASASQSEEQGHPLRRLRSV